MTKYNYDFYSDLDESQKQERQVIYVLSKKFNIDKKNIEINNDYRYDVKIPYNDTYFTFEIKDDDMSHKTQNVAIEYECRGKPSGIKVTEANYWVHKVKGEFYICKVEELKQHILKNKKEIRVFQNGGDEGSNTKLYLMNQDTFKLICRKL